MVPLLRQNISAHGLRGDDAHAGAPDDASSVVSYTKQLVNNIGGGFGVGPVEKLEVEADLATGSGWETQASHEILTVTGLCRIRLLCECTELITGAATIALSCGGIELIPATTATLIDADEIWRSENDGEIIATQWTNEALFDFISNGDDVGYTIGAAATTNGTLLFHIWWEPMESGATCVEGAGGTL